MRWITAPGYPGHLVAILAGALMTLSLAPFDLWPAALLSIALYYAGLGNLTPHQAIWRGWAYGFGLFAAGTSWIYVSIHDFGAAPAPLAGLLTLAFVAGLGLFYMLNSWLWVRWFRRPQAPLQNALAFAALWVLQEFLRSWFLTGFPWLYAGYSQTNGPLAALAPIGGVWIVSWVLAVTATLLINGRALIQRKQSALITVAMLVLLWGVPALVKNHQWTQAAGPELSVMAVQGNVAQNLKWDPAQLRAQLELYRRLTLEAPVSDLMIWPETAVPVLKEYAEGYIDELDDYARSHGSAFISGIPVRLLNEHGEKRYYNGLFSTGNGEGLYLKQKLVPFGEYVPLQEMLRGLIQFFDLPMSDFARGPEKQTLLRAKGYSIASFICYEVVYPDFAASLAQDSQLLLTVSNDAWFGHSIGPLQHLQMAQMRALESGRWMIRATNNGVTALIDPQGRITQQLPQFEQAVLQGKVTPMQGLTPFLQWQAWPTMLLCLGLLSLPLWRRR